MFRIKRKVITIIVSLFSRNHRNAWKLSRDDGVIKDLTRTYVMINGINGNRYYFPNKVFRTRPRCGLHTLSVKREIHNFRTPARMVKHAVFVALGRRTDIIHNIVSCVNTTRYKSVLTRVRYNVRVVSSLAVRSSGRVPKNPVHCTKASLNNFNLPRRVNIHVFPAGR